MNIRALPENIKTVNHGIGVINLNHLAAIEEFIGYPLIDARISEIHMKEDGAIDDTPVLALVHVIRSTGFVVSQISLSTLNHNLRKLGYEVTKCEM